MSNRNGLNPISAIADNAVANIGQPVQGEYIDGGSPAGERLVVEICNRLRASCKGYKSKMGSREGEEEYRKQMLLAFAENNITNFEMCIPALAYYRANDEWMPTPAQFIEQVLGSSGIPDSKTAYLEYCRNYANPKHEWTHPIVIETVRQGGIGFEMKALPAAQGAPMYDRNYQILLRRLRAGEDICSPIAKAIPEKIGRQCTKQENKNQLAKMRGEIGL